MEQDRSNSMWLCFRLENMNFCILSDHIMSIAVPGDIDPLPGVCKSIAGITTHGKELIRVIDMREVFGKMNLLQCVEEFSIMREMHISWVEDLEQCVRENQVFTKPINPHLCKFGKWYDGFKTDNSRLNRLLKKIEGPHASIHNCGAKIVELMGQVVDNSAAIEEILEQAHTLCDSEIVPLLDRLIDIYRSANRGVLLVVSGDNDETRTGLLVDEVKKLVACVKASQRPFDLDLERSPCLGDIIVAEEEVMLEVNVDQLLRMV